MKNLIYTIYFIYRKNFPIHKGKTFLGKILYYTLGDAVYKRSGSFFSLNPFALIDSYIIHEGAYENEVFERAFEQLSDGGVFLDIGANFGYFSVRVARLNKVTVIAVEPSPVEIQRVYKHITLNSLSNIVVLPVGLGNKNGIGFLNLADTSNSGMNSFLNKQPGGKTVEVNICRLDSILSEVVFKKIKCIKIDVEGFEWHVLDGFGKLLELYEGLIIIEITYSFRNYMPLIDPDLIYDKLYALGFKSHFGKRHATQYNEYFTK